MESRAAHGGQVEEAARELTWLLDPDHFGPDNPHRFSVLLNAWQMALLLHDGLRQRVGLPQLAQPGRRMEAIHAVERHLAAIPDDQAVIAMNENVGRCPMCGGEKQPGTTTFAVDLKFGVVVVREVPAFTCLQCGDAWIDDPKVVESWHAMNTWVRDNIPMAGEAYRQLINEFYKENRLMDGTLFLRGEYVELGRLRASLLNVIAESDHITPPCQSESVMNLVGSQDKEVFRVRGGHIGIMAGRGAEKTTWPHIDAWLAARSD